MAEGIERLVALAPKLAQLRAALTSTWLHARATQLAEIDLERPALQILTILATEGEPMRVGAIAAKMRVEGPHVTRQVTNLERRGLVRRVVDPSDRRARLVELTPAGREVNGRYQRVLRDWVLQAFADWPQEDLDAFVRLCGRVVDDLLAFLQQAEREERERRGEGRRTRGDSSA
ncbi:MAG: MarR family transcriptional regulator [Actinomadura rubrobrunea]|nr:MarR family transcriptional regulator [Actinomadura rubrobrunea]